jgi:hypothetical protein
MDNVNRILVCVINVKGVLLKVNVCQWILSVIIAVDVKVSDLLVEKDRIVNVLGKQHLG